LTTDIFAQRSQKVKLGREFFPEKGFKILMTSSGSNAILRMKEYLSLRVVALYFVDFAKCRKFSCLPLLTQDKHLWTLLKVFMCAVQTVK
jgi:hypothetical protein